MMAVATASFSLLMEALCRSASDADNGWVDILVINRSLVLTAETLYTHKDEKEIDLLLRSQ